MAAIAFRGLTPFLKTMDLARTIDFYVNLLGFVVDSQWPAGKPTDCILDNGHVHLAFVRPSPIHGRARRTSSATRSIAARLCSTSSSVVAHDDTLMRMAVCPCHTVPPTQQVPSAWIAAIT